MMKIGLGKLAGALMLVVGLAAALASPVVAQDAAQNKISGPARAVTSDTITIGTQRVLLWGADAPDPDQYCQQGNQKWDCAASATDALTTMLAAGDTSCDFVPNQRPDPFNRKFGVCTTGGKVLNSELIRQGWALDITSETKDYADIEKQAKADKVGLWATGVKFDKPWEWRRTH
ncbi:MAG: succinoglycan biosynthesis protein, partial [Hyphomicrobiales bacterium]|nr:succinoglycan biosynthesis protein [Hyphomicrobiales bacterium]